ncbi:MAG TPA: hypothetical protein VFW22_15010 [Pseudolabrys sp.]|nr:hypothetical protein [Pseudolabrys sp.]
MATSITIATPAFGEMFYTPYVQSVLRLQRAALARKWGFRHATVSYAYVGDSRNYLLTHWYDKSDSSHLLFVDADMGFDPQLIFDMVAFDKPVTGVIYTKRQVNLMKLAELAAKGEPPARAIARAHDFIVRPLRGRPPRRARGFIEVEGCGTGIMLIKREAVKTMLERLPALNDTKAKKTSPMAADLDRLIRAFDVIEVDGTPLVDDFAFCYRWQTLCQGELWARADQSVTHIGLHKFGGRYSDAAAQPRITVTRSIAPQKVVRVAASANGKSKGGNGAPKAVTGRIPQPQKGDPDER